MTVKKFVKKYIYPTDRTIPTQEILLNDIPILVRQGTTCHSGVMHINGFTGEAFQEPQDFVIIQGYNDHFDGPIIAIIYNEPRWSWFNDWSIWNEKMHKVKSIKTVLKLNRKIHELALINQF